MAEMTLANEFASVIVRKLATRNGERLEITSQYFGSSTRLDALQLEGLSWQDTEFFSQALRGSRGPVPPNHDDVGKVAPDHGGEVG